MKRITVELPMRLAPGSKHGLFKIDESTNDDDSIRQVWTGSINARDYVEISPEFPLDPNTRSQDQVSFEPNKKHAGVKAMQRTILHEPYNFGIYNLGIDLVGDEIKFISINHDDKKQTVGFSYNCLTQTERELSNEDKPENYGGLLNGGNTDQVVRHAYLIDPDSLNDVWITLTFLVNVDPALRYKVSENRNTSKQVPEYALSFAGGKFNELERYVKSLNLNVAFKADHTKDFDVRNLLQVLHLFNIKTNGTGKAPIDAYTTSMKLVKKYQADNNVEPFNYLYPKLGDFVKLWELAHTHVEQHIENEALRLGLDSNNPFRDDRMKELFHGVRLFKNENNLIGGESATYNIPAGYIFPVLASLRFLLTEVDGNLAWAGPNGTTAIDIWNTIGRELMDKHIGSVQDLVDLTRSGGKPQHMQAIGSNELLWTGLEGKLKSTEYFIMHSRRAERTLVDDDLISM